MILECSLIDYLSEANEYEIMFRVYVEGLEGWSEFE